MKDIHRGQQSRVQVSHPFYDFDSYVELHRWLSYWHQLRAIFRYRPRTVLEIGCGTGATTYMLRRHGVEVTTLDFDSQLRPDVVGDVRQVDEIFGHRSFDLVCAFQVLEHLPFEDFQPTLAKLATVAQRHVILSLPHCGYPFEVRARFLKDRFTLNWARRLSRYQTWVFNGQHYWELGARGRSRRRIRKRIAQELDILSEYFCENHSYHYFYETRVRKQ